MSDQSLPGFIIALSVDRGLMNDRVDLILEDFTGSLHMIIKGNIL